MKDRFSVETVRADHVIGNRAGFNALTEHDEVFRVVATVEGENGGTSRYIVAEFFPSYLEGEFATDGEAAADEYATSLNEMAS